MLTRRFNFVIALLLPLMVLRAMLPAGYMPVAENGVLRIAMCSDGLYSGAKDESRNQAPGGKHELPADSGNCPFASAAVNAAPPAVSTPVFRIDSEVAVVQVPAAPVRTASVVRVQSARGPPSISL